MNDDSLVMDKIILSIGRNSIFDLGKEWMIRLKENEVKYYQNQVLELWE